MGILFSKMSESISFSLTDVDQAQQCGWLHASRTVPETGCDDWNGIKGVKMCYKLGEIRESCGRGRKPGQGNEKQESPGKTRRVGKYSCSRTLKKSYKVR